MKLSRRLAIGFGGLLVMMVIIVFIALVNMNQLNSVLQSSHFDSDKINDYIEMERSVSLFSRYLLTMLHYTDRQSVLEEVKKVRAERANYDKVRERLFETVADQKGLELRNKMDENSKICQPLIDKVIKLVLADKKEEATEFLLEQTKSPLEAWQKSTQEAVEYIHGINEKETQAANTRVAYTIVIMILLGGASFVFGIFIAVLTSGSITRSVNRVTNNIVEGVNQVASASSQLSASSQQLSQGSSEQASSVDEVSATLEETASMLQQNTANTAQASQLTEQAKEFADKGDVEMQEMMNSMQEIKKSSDQIAKIIKLIDDIAFQTNILALNAAIEAARAGEAGMGFAVVAEEVRNLAQKSAQAAKDTTSIIESNIEISGKGMTVAERVRGSLREITTQTKKVNELMAEISAAGQEQLQGVDQINLSVAQVAVVTQQNAANAEESAAAAEEMNAQAEGMKSMVYELLALINGKSTAHKKEMEYSAREVHYLSNHSNLPNKKTDNKTIVTPEDIIPLEEDSHHF